MGTSCEHQSLAGDTGQVDAQPAKVPLPAQCVCVVITFSPSVCAGRVIRDGWWRVEGLSEVIFPSHLITGSLADSLDGSTARHRGAAVNRPSTAAQIDANLP